MITFAQIIIMFKIFTFVLALACINLGLHAQDLNLIPQPVAVKYDAKATKFKLSQQTQIVVEDTLSSSAQFFKQYVQKYYGISIAISNKTSATKNNIQLLLSTDSNTVANGYTLTADSNTVAIKAASANGIFYGVQTLIQLLPTEKSSYLAIPQVQISDYPRFEYRGMHLDVSRHFFEVAFVKEYIDYLALHKMNYFHWHLTDDQGWRIEIKKYPKLTEIGAWRAGSITGLFPGKGNEHIKYTVLPKDVLITPKGAKLKTDGIRYGGFYTQEEIKEVIKYAADRFITIIPEIEMPAHSMAVLAAYPEFGTEPLAKPQVAQTWGMLNKYNNVLQPSEKTFNFLQDVLTEVMDLFPSKYIHIGGDEASKIWWRKSPESQQIMKDNNLKSESALQSYIIHRIENFVNSKGKTIIGWDEILDGGLAPNAVVMSWRGEKGGIAAAKVKQKVIMSPEATLYINHSQFVKDDSLTANRYLPLDIVYNYEPVPVELDAAQAQYIWGAQGNLWSEYISNPAKVQYMIFPRIDAISEIQWSPKTHKNYPDFLNRLKTQFKRYDLMKLNYSKRYLTN